MPVVRGRIYAAEIEDLGEKHYLVVSNSQRNAALGDVLAVRLTTTRKPDIPSIVHFTSADEPWTGAALCDDVEKIYHYEIVRDCGALRAETMRRVDTALRAALNL